MTLTDTTGLLSATGAEAGTNGTNDLIISGTLTQVSGDLLTLTDKNSTAGVDNISVTATDSFGNSSGPAVVSDVTVAAAPVIAATATTEPGQTIGIGQSTTITGISLSESGATSTEIFTVTLTDTTGLLSATGAEAGTNGTNDLIISGTLTQVSGDLLTLTDKNSTAGVDNISVTATDSFGNSSGPAVVTDVTVAAAPVIAATATTEPADDRDRPVDDDHRRQPVGKRRHLYRDLHGDADRQPWPAVSEHVVDRRRRHDHGHRTRGIPDHQSARWAKCTATSAR